MKILKKEYDISEETLTLAINLSKSIEELGLSTYTFNSLWRWGIHTVADLCTECRSGRIKKIRGIGNKALIEIEHVFDEYFKEVTE